jgi:hypothetical protein
MCHTRFIVVASGLVWLALATAPAAQQDPSGAKPPQKDAQSRAFSGRILDGLGRPVPGVTVRLLDGRKRPGEPHETVLRTGADGRFSGPLPSGDDDAVISFQKDGYGEFSTIARSGREFILKRKVDWDEASDLPYEEGDKLELGLREVLASEEWATPGDGKLIDLLFRHPETLRPALRRLSRDAHVGAEARDWLDLLGDPGDLDLFPKGRRFAPKKQVRETDLVEALEAAARQRHFNSSAPEPSIEVDFIAFTKRLDRALVQCGINRAAMTGITWHFVFRKVDTQWQLCSAKEAGRS